MSECMHTLIIMNQNFDDFFECIKLFCQIVSLFLSPIVTVS